MTVNSDFRLALRQEDQFWNAYMAKIGTMEGALLIGSIHMRIVENSPTVKREFMDCMKSAFTRAIKDVLGISIDHWNDPRSAPETERSGNA